MKYPQQFLGVLILCSVTAQSASAQDPAALLAKADAFAHQGNWYKAAPLYADAESAFQRKGDLRNALYAKFGRLHRDVERGAYRAVHAEVSHDLLNPSVAGDPLLKIRALALLGNIDLNVDTRAGVEDWQEVLTVATKISDEKWQNRARGELALLAGVNGDLAAAAIGLHQAIAKAEAIGDVPGQLHFSVWLANGMAHNGRGEGAMKVLDRASEVAHKNDHELPLDWYSARITALTSVREDRVAKGRETARALLQVALDKARASGIAVAEVAFRNLAGQLELEAGNKVAAEAELKQALDGATKANLPREQAGALIRLSRLYRTTSRAHEALASIDSAIDALQSVEEAYDLPSFVAEKAEVQAELGDVREADALYQRASTQIEGLLVNAPSSMAKSSMLGTLSDIYVAHFRLAIDRLHNPVKAFQIIENVRGRTLFDSMRYAKTSNDAGNPAPEELEIVRLQKLLLHGRLTTQQTRRVLAQLDDAYYRLVPIEYRRARKEMSMLHSPPVSVSAIRRILGPDETLVEYVFDKQACYALQIDARGLHIHKLPGRAAIGNTAKAFVTAIRNQSDSTPSARALYGQVIEPLATRQAKSMIVIPDGSLHLVPMGALVDEKGTFLGSRMTISAAPSATIYYMLKTAGKRSLASKPFLGVAYSAGPRGAASANRELSDLRAANLKPLQFGREEIEEAARAMGVGSVTLDGAAGTEAALKQQPLADFKVLHFAAHGVSSESEPDRAALVFSPGGQTEDGLWQAREIRRARLNADVVVLSACETGSGRLQGQEGVMNLARAFLTAGAGSVVASLWSVDDRSTATLMEYFYAHLAQGASVRSALRQAQTDFVRDFGDKAKPYLWAGFEVIGDGTRKLKLETTRVDVQRTRSDLR